MVTTLAIGFFIGFCAGSVSRALGPEYDLQTRYEHVLRVTGYDDSRDVVVSIAGERVVILDPTQPKGEVK